MTSPVSKAIIPYLPSQTAIIPYSKNGWEIVRSEVEKWARTQVLNPYPTFTARISVSREDFPILRELLLKRNLLFALESSLKQRLEKINHSWPLEFSEI